MPKFIDGVGAARPSLSLGGKRYAFSKRLLLVLMSGLIVALYILTSGTSAVPKKIQQSVPFPVYYPRNLPSGYVLDMKSFRLPEAGVVLFTVTYGGGKNIVFSEQEQPSANDIDKFVSSYIPLNTELKLTVGQAKIGAYGTAPNIRTAVSLPVKDGPWLIITAPSDMSHEDLVRILNSIAK